MIKLTCIFKITLLYLYLCRLEIYNLRKIILKLFLPLLKRQITKLYLQSKWNWWHKRRNLSLWGIWFLQSSAEKTLGVFCPYTLLFQLFGHAFFLMDRWKKCMRSRLGWARIPSNRKLIEFYVNFIYVCDCTLLATRTNFVYNISHRLHAY